MATDETEISLDSQDSSTSLDATDDTTGDDAADTTTTTNQRLAFTIPSPSTTMVLGSRHWDGVGYSGFNVITTADVFVMGTADDSTATIQTPGQITIHSTAGPMTVASKDDMLLFSEDKGFLAAKNYLMITSGAEGPQKPGIGVFSSAKPEGSLPLEDITGHIKHVRNTIKTANTAASIASAVISTLSILASRTATATNIMMGVLALMFKALNKTCTPNYDGDVHVFGADTATLASARSTNILAGNSVFTSAPYITSMAIVAASVVSPVSASVQGGLSASLTGYREAKITSLRNVNIAARTDTVSLRGKTLQLGSVGYDWPQLPTGVVNLCSTTSINIAVVPGLPVATLNLGMTGVDVTGRVVIVDASTAAIVNCGMFSLDVSPTGAAMVNKLAGADAYAVKQAAHTAYQAQVDAAYKAYEAAVEAFVAMVVPPASGPVAIADAVRSSGIATANATLAAAAALAKTAAGFLRVGVSATDVHMAGGIGKISIDAVGNITIDGMGMPITIKTGAASIVLTPMGIKMGPILSEG